MATKKQTRKSVVKKTTAERVKQKAVVSWKAESHEVVTTSMLREVFGEVRDDINNSTARQIGAMREDFLQQVTEILFQVRELVWNTS